ncbi:sensor domain-containing diguanylate cyclase [Catellatospora citrea]|uniref:sensor domain-containing diguanylate cyclase n=1 Tax=Catellatospora citrea TaxID=53366 RepID=UPI000FF28F77|nr:sensor domain-containing diguanylate cyclase [Catellatospora citrea]RKE05928.1 PAS domain S-box-containing protein/diguanylate cyclase (GGDEF)-like protein [Catellatospora citrea]
MNGSVPQRHGGRVLDPVLGALAAVSLVSIGALLLAVVPAGVVDAVQAAVWLLFAWLCRQVVAKRRIAPAARRFWRGIAVAGLVFAVGNLVTLFGGLARPPQNERAVILWTLLVAVGVAILGWAMYAFPLVMPCRARARLRLDVAVIMVALVMLAWHLCVPGGSAPLHTARLYVTVLASAMALLAAFGAVKLLISGTAPFTPGAGVALGAGVVLGAWSVLHLLNLQASEARLLNAAQLASALLFAVAARAQYLQMAARPSGLTKRRRPAHSRLPYLAVAATQLMLVAEVWRSGLSLRGWGMVIGAGTVVTLVMFRQNLAFADNAQLLDRLRHQEKRFRSLVQHASDLTLLVDADGVVRYASPALRDLLGVDPRRAVGRPLTGLLRPDDAPAVEKLLADVLADPAGSVRRQVRAHHVDGSIRWGEALATNGLQEPDVAGVIINIRDVTEARSLQDLLRHQATHDELTGLPNRALLNEKARQPRPEAPRQEAVLLLDLDDFKAVNDELGHQTGDQVLVVVADRLRRCVRPTDTVARLGGDEFVVLLTGTTAAGAVATARRILSALAEPAMIDGHRLSARASIGIAIGSDKQFDALLRDADIAMYEAKRNGTGIEVHTAPGVLPGATASGAGRP